MDDGRRTNIESPSPSPSPKRYSCTANERKMYMNHESWIMKNERWKKLNIYIYIQMNWPINQLATTSLTRPTHVFCETFQIFFFKKKLKFGKKKQPPWTSQRWTQAQGRNIVGHIYPSMYITNRLKGANSYTAIVELTETNRRYDQTYGRP